MRHAALPLLLLTALAAPGCASSDDAPDGAPAPGEQAGASGASAGGAGPVAGGSSGASGKSGAGAAGAAPGGTGGSAGSSAPGAGGSAGSSAPGAGGSAGSSAPGAGGSAGSSAPGAGGSAGSSAPGAGGSAGGAGPGGAGGAGGSGGAGGGGAGGAPAGTTFRLGINYGHRNASWGDAEDGLLASQVGCNSARLKLPEAHLDKWGYEIEVGDMQSYAKNGLGDHIAFLIGATAPHSTAPGGTPDWQLDYYIPKDLHEPISLPDGTINPGNPWAAYVYKTVSTYKPYVKLWEVWNEPDWVPDYKTTLKWETDPPAKAELPRFNGSIFDYVRLLRVTREAALKADPEARIALGGIGYPSFLSAILRYTDDPAGGGVSPDHPAKGGDYFDVLNFHYYPLYTPGNSEAAADGFFAQRDAMAARLAAAGVTGKLWNATETGAPREALGGQPGGEAYARNYLLKVMSRAHEEGFLGVDWFILSDSAAPGSATDPYSLMGLYLDIKDLAATDQAVRTPSGVAYHTLGQLLGKAKSDPDGTAALALPASVGGGAYRLPDGRRAFVLWARPAAGAEEASASYALASDKPVTRHAWDDSATNAATVLSPQGGAIAIELGGSPEIFIEQ
jgi:hypothetical protein